MRVRLRVRLRLRPRHLGSEWQHGRVEAEHLTEGHRGELALGREQD